MTVLAVAIVVVVVVAVSSAAAAAAADELTCLAGGPRVRAETNCVGILDELSKQMPLIAVLYISTSRSRNAL